jgi:hypothetical protein
MKQGGGTIIIHRKSLDCSVLLLHCMSLFMALNAKFLVAQRLSVAGGISAVTATRPARGKMTDAVEKVGRARGEGLIGRLSWQDGLIGALAAPGNGCLPRR